MIQLQRLESATQTERQVHELLCVPEVYRYLADGAPPPIDIARAWLAASTQDWRAYGGGLWALRMSPDEVQAAEGESELLGLVQLTHDTGRELELTYLLHPKLWGSGFATRMAHTAMALCFERERADKIWAGADEPNQASVAVMQRLGMRFKRHTDYPSGRGIEYEIGRQDFDRQAINLLAFVD